MGKRMNQWRSRVDSWQGEKRLAEKLYCGGHWSVVRRLTQDQLPSQFRSFVISAGFGLISMNARIAPYGATFAPGQSDSIAIKKGTAGPDQAVKWWNQLVGWRPKGILGVRSITGAMRKWPNHVHLFALSPYYLDAIFEDLTRARASLSNPNDLIVISTGKKRHGELKSNIVSAPAELQQLLGGALVSLNVRLAAVIVNSIASERLTPDAVREFVSTLLESCDPRIVHNRRKVPDQEVLQFIKLSSAQAKTRSYTTMLKLLRKSGCACEMKRFRTLFRTIHPKEYGP